MVDEIADLGASHVALVVTWAQRDVRSSRIARSGETIDDAVLEAAIARAHRRGLAVVVFPILTVERTAPGQWRGTVDPEDRDAWWLDYERFILHYAGIAAARKTAALLVGSELGSTETWRDRWYHLLSRVERVYDGALIYSANWDHYPMVSFWARLDAVGVTGYFRLTEDNDASQAELTRAWRRRRAELEAFAAEQGKPLWITEVGYRSADGAAIDPWDYTREAEVDLEEQRRCYAAFIDAWTGSSLAGAFFWNWYDDGERGYTPRGKPAEQLLRDWYR
jgi:hypothetical protein